MKQKFLLALIFVCTSIVSVKAQIKKDLYGWVEAWATG